MRCSEIRRKTNETNIEMTLELDGTGKCDIRTGAGFLDHMLELFARHGRFDLQVYGSGDTHVDLHHIVEDTGIVLGSAFAEALGEKRGIKRYGSFLLPMDESLVLCAVDISGRAYLNFDMQLPAARVGEFDTELASEFLWGFVRALEATVHVKQLAGSNTHHLLEAMFKGLGRAMSQAVSIDPALGNEIPSTKGVL